MENSNPNFTLTGSINYELKFGDKGIELVWNDKTNPSKLVSLIISHEVAKNAKANFDDNYDAVKRDKKLLDRYGWTAKTVTGLNIFVGSFIEAVIEENTLPIITAESAGTDTTQKTDNPSTLTEGNNTITLQQIPTEE